MENRQKVKNRIASLLHGQRLGVLSTHCKGHPYASLVAFVVAEDLSRLFFVTSRATRKYANIMDDARVALLIDSRSNQPSDFHEAKAVTVMGHAAEVGGSETSSVQKAYLARHPYLTDFVNAPSCVLMAVTVDRYILVERFQNVTEYRVTPSTTPA